MSVVGPWRRSVCITVVQYVDSNVRIGGKGSGPDVYRVHLSLGAGEGDSALAGSSIDQPGMTVLAAGISRSQILEKGSSKNETFCYHASL
jgi:hypothetical protein